MPILLKNLRYAIRQLRRSPGFALTAILTLALGVGANVVVFSVLNTLDPQAPERAARRKSVQHCAQTCGLGYGILSQLSRLSRS